MTRTPRSGPSPGAGRGRDRRRPRQASPTARRTSRVASSVDADARAASTLKLTGRAAVLLLVLMVLAVSYASSARAWLRQRGEINDLTASIAQQRQAVATLSRTARRWHDPAYIRQQARMRFGFVMPGETGYRVVDANGDVLSNGDDRLAAPPAPQTSTNQQWWIGIWGSVTEAGMDPADAPPARTPPTQIGGGHPRQSTHGHR